MNFGSTNRRARLLTSVALGLAATLAVSGLAQAQTPQDPDAEDEEGQEVDTIVVTGIRSSIESSIPSTPKSVIHGR